TGDVVEWWYDFQDGSSSEKEEPAHTFPEAGFYSVMQTVYNQFGCVDSTLRPVKVDGFLVYIPNAFTPNEDGINEIFRPSIYGEEIRLYSFRIWNRWGEEVFFTEDPEEGWNGAEPSGKHYAESEVYPYKIVITGKTTNIQEI